MYKKVMMERSTHGIPEREGYSLKWSIGRVFVQNVPAMAVRYPQDAVWKVAPNWNVECGALPCRHSRIVPVKGHDEYYKGGTARVFALCAEKEKAFCTEGVSFILRRNT